MQTFSADETRSLLPYGPLAAALREMLRAQKAEQAMAPPRQAVALADNGVLLLMPAVDAHLGIVKLVTVHPANPAYGRPSIQGEVLVFDAASGQRLYLLDGATVTARRTAALSVLAADLLAPDTRGPLLIIGAGVQARAHLEAWIEGGRVSHVFVQSRTIAHAEALATHGRRIGATVRVIADPSEVIAETPLIVTATTSAQPVLPAQVRPDAFIAAVGAYRPEMAEIPPSLVRQCRVYADTLEGAKDEAGDLLQADVEWSQVSPLHAALPQPTSDRPILFKSVGHALWDLAAAHLVHRQIRGQDHPP
jgi:1-piperideine-2-carboxylate/1-pyrroline-2-carboxylate reductase [NAD(P)H]